MGKILERILDTLLPTPKPPYHEWQSESPALAICMHCSARVYGPNEPPNMWGKRRMLAKTCRQGRLFDGR